VSGHFLKQIPFLFMTNFKLYNMYVKALIIAKKTNYFVSQSRARITFLRSVSVVIYLMAIGLIIICTAPDIRAGPRTNMNSYPLSAASSRVSMFSRIYIPF
jgi:hypothetical protein